MGVWQLVRRCVQLLLNTPSSALTECDLWPADRRHLDSISINARCHDPFTGRYSMRVMILSLTSWWAMWSRSRSPSEISVYRNGPTFSNTLFGYLFQTAERWREARERCNTCPYPLIFIIPRGWMPWFWRLLSVCPQRMNHFLTVSPSYQDVSFAHRVFSKLVGELPWNMLSTFMLLKDLTLLSPTAYQSHYW